jgi:hypothetical protein
VLQRARHRVLHHALDQARQVDAGAGQGAPRGLGARQRQQLVDGVGGARAGAGDLLQRAADFHRVGFALGQFGLHAQPGQRRLELVRGVGQEALLRAQRGFQPRQQVVDGRHQRRHLLRNEGLFDRAQVVGLARADALLQFVERADAAHQRQPHQQHRQRQDHELRHHHALDDLGGQGRALALGLGHLHQHQALPSSPKRDSQV